MPGARHFVNGRIAIRHDRRNTVAGCHGPDSSRLLNASFLCESCDAPLFHALDSRLH